MEHKTQYLVTVFSAYATRRTFCKSARSCRFSAVMVTLRISTTTLRPPRFDFLATGRLVEGRSSSSPSSSPQLKDSTIGFLLSTLLLLEMELAFFFYRRVHWRLSTPTCFFRDLISSCCASTFERNWSSLLISSAAAVNSSIFNSWASDCLLNRLISSV